MSFALWPRMGRAVPLSGLAALGLLGLAAAPTSAQSLTYTYTTVVDPQGVNGTVATGINSSGEIVGFFYDSSNAKHGFVDNNGTFTTLDAPGAGTGDLQGTTLSGINSQGDLVGYYQDNAGNIHGFEDIGGTISTYDYPQAVGTFLSGINDRGVIVGAYVNQFPFLNAFQIQNGTPAPITIPNAIYSVASGVNNTGQIVGSDASVTTGSGYLDSNGTFTAIVDPNATNGATNPNGIIDNGVVVGTYSDFSGAQYGFVEVGGVYTTLSDPNVTTPSANYYTNAFGINNSGVVVGAYTDAQNIVNVPNVGALIAPSGFIAKPNFVPQATPEPSSLGVFALAGLGLFGLTWRKRRRTA